MIHRCYVCADSFWRALRHCKYPVFLADHGEADLRGFMSEQRHTLLNPAGHAAVALDLHFTDDHDYTRFVLAYLLSEASEGERA